MNQDKVSAPIVVKRGDIVYVEIHNESCESIQDGNRPAVVVSNDKANKFSPIIHIVPLTSKDQKKRYLPTHKLIVPWRDTIKIDCHSTLKEESMALCEQLMPISKDSVKERICKVDSDTLSRILDGIFIQLGVIES